MILVKVEVNLMREKPFQISKMNIEKETRRTIYFQDPGKKGRQALARTSLGKPILLTPLVGRFFALSFQDDRAGAEICPAVTQGKMELLCDMESALQRCAVRLNEQMEELYALAEPAGG